MRAIVAAPVALFLAGAFHWLEGCEAAIGLTYDDVLASHLSVAAPQQADGLR